MIAISSTGGHSAQVKMSLLLDGNSIPVVQMGPDFVLIETTVEHSPCIASLVFQVDQNESRWNVYLPKGLSPNTKKVAISAAPTEFSA